MIYAVFFILARGDARSAVEAVALVLERRPRARMNATQRKTLNEVAESYAAGSRTGP